MIDASPPPGANLGRTMAEVSAPDLARELNIRHSRLTELLHDITPQEERPGRGKRWGWTREEADTLKEILAPEIKESWKLPALRKLSDDEIAVLAEDLIDGGPCELPKGADPNYALEQLRVWRPGLEGVHIAEETPGDGVTLHA